MRSTYGYGPYKGRFTFRTVLKIIIIFLAFVLVLGLLAVTFLGRYMVYSADGMRLELPFFQQQPPATPETTPEESLPVVVAPVPSVAVTPVPSAVVTPVPSAVVTPAPPIVVAPVAFHVAPLPRGALSDGSGIETLTGQGANAGWFDMKGDDGTLAFVSAQPLAIAAEATASYPTLNASIQAMNAQKGRYSVARVSCFKDDLLSNADRSLNITTNSGYRWTDEADVKWSSPTSKTVRSYLVGLCRELAALGFDEILLDNAGYPTQGQLGYIKKGAAYDRTQLATVIDGFYKEVKAGLSDYPNVKLSVVTTAAALGETPDKSGQTPANLVASADRVWVAAPAGTDISYVDALTEAGMENAQEKRVTLRTMAGPADGNWAIWP